METSTDVFRLCVDAPLSLPIPVLPIGNADAIATPFSKWYRGIGRLDGLKTVDLDLSSYTFRPINTSLNKNLSSISGRLVYFRDQTLEAP